MALTLESGSFVKFQYNLGTRPIDIINWAVRVRPGHWYTAYATRSVTSLTIFVDIVNHPLFLLFSCHLLSTVLHKNIIVMFAVFK